MAEQIVTREPLNLKMGQKLVKMPTATKKSGPEDRKSLDSRVDVKEKDIPEKKPLEGKIKETIATFVKPEKDKKARIPTMGLNHEALETAAYLMVQTLPGQTQEVIIEMARYQLEIPLWHYLCGMWLRCFNDGDLVHYDVDPAWEDGTFGSGSPICKVCDKPFPSERPGQVVCGQECGIEYATRKRSNVG
uniref:Uncharacterized protein n=1 Tax=viral metagenome TaxID=1070528 RepID=A0A6M3KZ61_9ZZZZ